MQSHVGVCAESPTVPGRSRWTVAPRGDLNPFGRLMRQRRSARGKPLARAKVPASSVPGFPTDPFDQVAHQLRQSLTLQEKRADWIIHCPTCGAGWIVARPRKGEKAGMGPGLWNVVEHVVGHTRPGVRGGVW